MMTGSVLPYSVSRSVECSRRVVKRYTKTQLRRIQRKECQRLKKIVPSVANRGDVNSLQVIEEAAKYIDSLHQALMERLAPTSSQPLRRAVSSSSMSSVISTGPSGSSSVSPPDVRTVIATLLPPGFVEKALGNSGDSMVNENSYHHQQQHRQHQQAVPQTQNLVHQALQISKNTGRLNLPRL